VSGSSTTGPAAQPAAAGVRPWVGRLEGKVAIVTGAASGIGRATMAKLIAEGARVVCADIDEVRGRQAVEEHGDAARFLLCDVGELSQLEATVAFAVETFGGLDIIHNNALWSGGGPVHRISPEDWDKSMRVMLTGVFYGCRAAIPEIVKRGGGSIVNTASIEAFGGEIYASPYSTAKAGVVNFTRNVAIEYGRLGVRANAICPGNIETPLFDRFIEAVPRSREQVAELSAIGRIIRPDEIANVVAFLCSEEASAITGAALVIDGGLTSFMNLSGHRPLEGL
jgi:meso-butanediol dehydrogenase/(S,S)-butanediol dehydrogenase/diacetyl reductase